MRLISPRGLIVATLAVCAVAAAGAQAGEPPVDPPMLPVTQQSDRPAIEAAQGQKAARFYYDLPQARYSNAEMKAFADAGRPGADSNSVTRPAPARDASSDGIDYGDAALGAGITGGIALLIVAGSITVRRRRQPATHKTA